MPPLNDRLAAIDPRYATQVKEKFGTLRYYCAPIDDLNTEVLEAFRDVIDQAARMPAVTCERCGKPGVLHRRGHWRKRSARHVRNSSTTRTCIV